MVPNSTTSRWKTCKEIDFEESKEAIMTVTVKPGYIVVPDGNGTMQLPITNFLRAQDIPALTYTQVQAITALANLLAYLIKTLIARDVLDESFMGDYDLEGIIQSIEAMGGDFGEPDISVTPAS